MIRYTLLITFLMLTLYGGLLQLFPQKPVGQNYYQRNMVRAQEFAYTDYKPRNIVVGSSLSAGLMTDSLPGFVNLSFIGLGVIDGLALIEAKGVMPDTVFIETNKFFRGKEKDFLERILNPVMYQLCKAVPLFRAGNQPLVKTSYFFTRDSTLVVDAKCADRHRTDLFCERLPLMAPDKYERMDSLRLKSNIEKYTRGIPKFHLDANINLLRDYVARFEARHVKVVFFEMPVNPALDHLTESVEVRRIMRENFPSEKYTTIPAPDLTDYLTKDGQHLFKSDYIRYMIYFCDWINKDRNAHRK